MSKQNQMMGCLEVVEVTAQCVLPTREVKARVGMGPRPALQR